MNIALDYGGHDDIIRAVKNMIKDGVNSEKVDKKLFEGYLDTKTQPYPYVDLIIRPQESRELRDFYFGRQSTQNITGKKIIFRILHRKN